MNQTETEAPKTRTPFPMSFTVEKDTLRIDFDDGWSVDVRRSKEFSRQINIDVFRPGRNCVRLDTTFTDEKEDETA